MACYVSPLCHQEHQSFHEGALATCFGSVVAATMMLRAGSIGEKRTSVQFPNSRQPGRNSGIGSESPGQPLVGPWLASQSS